ncbi:MAG: efflux RND transporter periplasmic adaptor subunit [Cellvibrionaceae bacterium]
MSQFSVFRFLRMNRTIAFSVLSVVVIIATLIIATFTGVIPYGVPEWMGVDDSGHRSSLTPDVNGSSDSSSPVKPSSSKVLYWVAPMDANYRRDQPGKSPMGMALVPVYDRAGSEAGDVQVSAAIINTLGVRTEVASRQLLRPHINAFGIIAHDENSRLRMTVRSQGWIEKLYVSDEGEMVREGDLLFEFYSPELVHAQDDYLRAMVANESRLIRGALGRMRSLAIPESRIQALNNLSVKTHLPDSFRNLAYRAPRSGHLSSLGVREGSFVAPSSVVMELVSIESVWLIADVPERKMSQVKLGQNAKMQLPAFPNKQWFGRVEYLYPMLDSKTRSLRVRLRFDNPERRLKPNMFASVNIDTSPFEALSVPIESIIKLERESRVVLALGKGEFRSVTVETGWQVGDRQVILSGLSDGDKVVTSGQFLLDSESSLRAAFSRMESLP